MTRRWYWLLPLLFLCVCGAPPSSATTSRNAVRERGDRTTPTPPADVRVTAEGVWLIPCVAGRPKYRCPVGVTCLYDPDAIQDGPDGWPNSILRPECFTEDGTLIPEMEMEEIVVDVIPPDVVIDWHCQSTLDECVSKMNTYCAGVQAPRSGVAFGKTQVTEYKMGKACKFTCAGDGRERECLINPPPAKPKPGDVAMPIDLP